MLATGQAAAVRFAWRRAAAQLAAAQSSWSPFQDALAAPPVALSSPSDFEERLHVPPPSHSSPSGEGSVLVVTYTNDASSVASWLRRHVEERRDVVVGFDTEMVPHSNVVTTVQLAVQDAAIVIHHARPDGGAAAHGRAALTKHARIGRALQAAVFGNPHVTLVGVQVEADARTARRKCGPAPPRCGASTAEGAPPRLRCRPATTRTPPRGCAVSWRRRPQQPPSQRTTPLRASTPPSPPPPGQTPQTCWCARCTRTRGSSWGEGNGRRCHYKSPRLVVCDARTDNQQARPAGTLHPRRVPQQSTGAPPTVRGGCRAGKMGERGRAVWRDSDETAIRASRVWTRAYHVAG